jgi:hypothetical protein
VNILAILQIAGSRTNPVKVLIAIWGILLLL